MSDLQLWTNAGKLIIDNTGKLVECTECPCVDNTKFKWVALLTCGELVVAECGGGFQNNTIRFFKLSPGSNNEYPTTVKCGETEYTLDPTNEKVYVFEEGEELDKVTVTYEKAAEIADVTPLLNGNVITVGSPQELKYSNNDRHLLTVAGVAGGTEVSIKYTLSVSYEEGGETITYSKSDTATLTASGYFAILSFDEDEETLDVTSSDDETHATPPSNSGLHYIDTVCGLQVTATNNTKRWVIVHFWHEMHNTGETVTNSVGLLPGESYTDYFQAAYMSLCVAQVTWALNPTYYFTLDEITACAPPLDYSYVISGDDIDDCVAIPLSNSVDELTKDDITVSYLENN